MPDGVWVNQRDLGIGILIALGGVLGCALFVWVGFGPASGTALQVYTCVLALLVLGWVPIGLMRTSRVVVRPGTGIELRMADLAPRRFVPAPRRFVPRDAIQAVEREYAIARPGAEEGSTYRIWLVRQPPRQDHILVLETQLAYGEGYARRIADLLDVPYRSSVAD